MTDTKIHDVCPVKRAINHLYTGGRATTDPQQRHPKLSVSYGDMGFLITCKVMDLARFELTKPTLGQCIERFLLPLPTPKQYYEKHMMSTDKQLFITLFMRVCSLVKARITQQKKKDFILPPPIKVQPVDLCLSPKSLHTAVNWVLQLANSDVKFAAFSGEFPDVVFPQIPNTLDASSGLKYLQDTQKIEIIILDYAAKVEEYQTDAYAVLESLL